MKEAGKGMERWMKEISDRSEKEWKGNGGRSHDG